MDLFLHVYIVSSCAFDDIMMMLALLTKVTLVTGGSKSGDVMMNV